jgi:cytochrome P450
MGVPDGDRHDLLAWSNATLDFEGRELGDSSEQVAKAAASMASYGAKLIAEKKQAAPDDIISIVAHAQVEDEQGDLGPLTDLELLMFFNLLVVAGSETTRNSIALGMVALIEHPDQLESLRSDRSLMPAAVEEILRWTSATLYNRRTARQALVALGQPRRIGVRGSVPVRYPPGPESAPDLRASDPLLHGGQPCSSGDPGDPR